MTQPATRRTSWTSGCFVPRHRHANPYIAVVLQGGYEEAGDRGRIYADAGDVLFHRPHEAHLNRMNSKGAEVLDLMLPEDFELSTASARIADPDRVARLAEHDAVEAVRLVLVSLVPHERHLPDWPDLLGAALMDNPNLVLAAWARSH